MQVAVILLVSFLCRNEPSCKRACTRVDARVPVWMRVCVPGSTRRSSAHLGAVGGGLALTLQDRPLGGGEHSLRSRQHPPTGRPLSACPVPGGTPDLPWGSQQPLMLPAAPPRAAPSSRQPLPTPGQSGDRATPTRWPCWSPGDSEGRCLSDPPRAGLGAIPGGREHGSFPHLLLFLL